MLAEKAVADNLAQQKRLADDLLTYEKQVLIQAQQEARIKREKARFGAEFGPGSKQRRDRRKAAAHGMTYKQWMHKQAADADQSQESDNSSESTPARRNQGLPARLWNNSMS